MQARQICEIQHNMGRRESTLFVHTPMNMITNPVFNYLMHLKFIDGGKTFMFNPGDRVLYQTFQDSAVRWIRKHGLEVDTPECDCLQYFGLYVDGDDVVGLGYE